MTPKCVYDFLCVDVNRIARLVAQLDGHGLLDETVREIGRSAQPEVKLGIPWLGLRLQGEMKDKREDHYDPSWRLPVLFLDRMRDHFVTQSSAWQVGQIVTLTGQIEFRDFIFTGQMLATSVVRSELGGGGKVTAESPSDMPWETIVNAAQAMPNLLQAVISDGTVKAWSTLNTACTTASTGDLILKCGWAIEGNWTLTGILDATRLDDLAPRTSSSAAGFERDFRTVSDAIRYAVGGQRAHTA